MSKFLDRINYIPGRANLAVTIYVPWDCPNQCPFCTSKKDYADTSNFSLKEILYSLKKLRHIGYIHDVVITGGEPFANLPSLSRLLHAIYRTLPHCSVFINTTLPTHDEEERENILNFLRAHRIDCLNVSRHMHFTTKLENQDFLKRVANTVKVRINSVIMGVTADYKTENIRQFIAKYDFVSKISFRGDYTKIKNQDDLRTMQDPFLRSLFQIYSLSYTRSGGCLVCNDDSFRGISVDVSYHRGLEESLVIVDDGTYIVNDIIIHQDGSISLDWGGKYKWNEDIRNQWSKESYIADPVSTPNVAYGSCNGVLYSGPEYPNGDSMSDGYGYCAESCSSYNSCGGSGYAPRCGSYNSCGG